jgi:hypothetical protein
MRFIHNCPKQRTFVMDHRDQELLDRQLRKVTPPRHDAILALAIVAMFFAGFTLGGMLVAQEDQPLRIAANDGGAAAPLFGAPPTTAR